MNTRPLQEIEACQHENWQRSTQLDIAARDASMSYDGELRGHLHAAVTLAAEAVAAAGKSAKRIDAGVIVVAEKGAATKQAADFAHRWVKLRDACEATRARRLSDLKAGLAQRESLAAERMALEAEAQAARTAEDEATRAAKSEPHYLGRRR